MSIACSSPKRVIALLFVPLFLTLSCAYAQPVTEPVPAKDPKAKASQDAPPAVFIPQSRIPAGESIDLSTLSLLVTPPWEFPVDSDEELSKWLEQEKSKMPSDIREVGTRGEQLRLVQERVDNLLIAAWHHYKTYPASSYRVDVLDLLCELTCLNEQRFLHAENQRNKHEFGVDMTADDFLDLSLRYFRPVTVLASSGVKESKTPLVKSRFVKTLGVCHLALGGRFMGAQLFEDAKILQRTAGDYFAAAMELDPMKLEDVDLSIKLIDTMLQSGENGRAATEARRFLTKHVKSKYWPHVFYFLAKALRRDGKLEEVLALWTKYGIVLQHGEAGLPLPKWHTDPPYVVPEEHRSDYALYAERVGFYLGFYRIALGDVSTGTRLLRNFTVDMNERESENKLMMPGKVFRDAMAFYYIANLENLVNKEAPAFDIGDGWVNPPSEDADKAKATVLVFADSSRAQGRHREYFHAFAKVQKELWAKGLRSAWISAASRMKDATLEGQKEEMRLVADSLKATGAYGLDSDMELPVWMSYGVNRGSVHLFVLDADKKVRWHLIDPMAWDIGLIRAVIDRVMASDGT